MEGVVLEETSPHRRATGQMKGPRSSGGEANKGMNRSKRRRMG